MILLRGIAAVAGIGILAAVAHVTIMATGGYSDTNAAITIALALGVAIGAPVAGICFERGRWVLGLFAVLALIAGELYGFGATASWHVAHIEAQAAPIHDAEAKRKEAQDWLARLEHDDRVQRAERALRDAQADARTKSTDKGCGQNCRAILAKTVDDATAAVADAQSSLQLEKRQARAALDHAPQPGSATPLADRLGVQPWALDLILAGLRSFACTVLAAVLLAFAAHGRKPHAAPETSVPTMMVVERPRAIAGVALVKDERKAATDKDVARFMLACLPRARGQEAEMGTVYARYCRWCEEQSPPLKPHDKPGFALAIKAWCERGRIDVRRDGGRVYCVDVKLAS